MTLNRYLPKKISTPVQKLRPQPAEPFILLCFLTLVAANSVLAYSSSSITVKTLIVVLGLIIPLLLAGTLLPKKELLRSETLPSLSVWIWLALTFSALFLRLFRLTTLSTWPVADEGMFGYFTTLLEQKWNWEILHSPAQEPILYSWGELIFFKLFGHSLFTFWLYPALLSLACVPLLWLACRQIFSRSISIFAACGAVSNFWLLYVGRFSSQLISAVFWEFLTIAALACYLKTTKEPKTNWRLPLLAVLTGIGFYSYLAWPFVAAIIFLALAANPSLKLKNRLKDLLTFSTLVLVIVIPIILAYKKEYRGYFNHLWAYGAPHDLMDRFKLPLAYLFDFFWGYPCGFFHFGPIWGGFLNPIAASLFFLGLVYLLQNIRERFSLWSLTALFVFFLPALLTNNNNNMRLTPMIPLFILICALGTQFLLSHLPSIRWPWIFALVLIGSASLDSYHLLHAYAKDWQDHPDAYRGHKSPEFYHAYSILKPVADQKGAGLILLNFDPDPYNQTLFVATYSFNAAANPRLNPVQAQWAAVLANIQEQPYLSKEFPGGSWTWLSYGLGRSDGGFLLDVIPIQPQNQERLLRWTRADQSLKELTRLIIELGVTPDQKLMKDVLEKAYPLFQGDPLLESRYWRAMAVHHLAEQNLNAAIEDERKAIRLGYPMAHLYNELGCLLSEQGKTAESRKAFENAIRLKPNCTNAGENLRKILLSQRAAGKNQLPQ